MPNKYFNTDTAPESYDSNGNTKNKNAFDNPKKPNRDAKFSEYNQVGLKTDKEFKSDY